MRLRMLPASMPWMVVSSCHMRPTDFAMPGSPPVNSSTSSFQRRAGTPAPPPAGSGPPSLSLSHLAPLVGGIGPLVHLGLDLRHQLRPLGLDLADVVLAQRLPPLLHLFHLL